MKEQHRPTVHVITYGCQMNVFDSRRMVQVLGQAGYSETPDPEDADVVLVNTCSVREKPEKRVLATLSRLKTLKVRNPHMVLGLCGCVAQQHGKALLDQLPWLDLVVGPDRIADLPKMVEDARLGARVAKVEHQATTSYEFVSVDPTWETGPTAFLTIMKGCDMFCAYCIVPFVRGREVSKPLEVVVSEARSLVAHGIKEITLLGQNVNHYGRDLPGKIDLVDLLVALHEVEGLERIRFVTAHPADANERLLKSFGTLPRLCEYLHLPVQAGSDRVLQAMNRRYTVADYLKKIEVVRAACPDIALSTDVIVGFPGERREDFEGTLRLLEQVQFDTMFSFKYSPRPGTKAARLHDDVPSDEKARRLAELQALQDSITRRRMQRFLGRTEEVLVEGQARRGEGRLRGRTRTNFVVNFEAAKGEHVRAGELCLVRIDRVLPHCLIGRAVPTGRKGEG